MRCATALRRSGRPERRPASRTTWTAGRAGSAEALLRELVLVDVCYRRRRGEPCGPEPYQGRFPEFDPRWLQDHSANEKPSASTVPPAPTDPRPPR